MPAPSLYVYVALYIRLSVEDNKKRGCSVENQKLVLNDFLADKPDFVVYDTYIDNGLTGTNFHRPGFQQMLSDIEAGHINCVIVKDLSRLGRNSIDSVKSAFALLLTKVTKPAAERRKRVSINYRKFGGASYKKNNQCNVR